MKRFWRKAAIVAAALACILVFAACGGDKSGGKSEFEKALKDETFSNVTMEIDVPSMMNMKAKISGNKGFITMSMMAVITSDIYQEIAADGSIEQYSKTSFLGETEYTKEHIDAADAGAETPTPDSMGISTFDETDFVKDSSGYYVLTDAAKSKSKYKDLTEIAGTAEGTFNFKLKIASDKLTELVVDFSVDVLGVITPMTMKCTFTDYGSTVVTAPSWLSLCV